MFKPFLYPSASRFLIGLLALGGNLAHGSALVYCSEAAPDRFNPQMSLSGAAFDASVLLYGRLLEFNPKGTALIPDLAEKWESSKDGLSHTFYLRKNVSFYPRGGFKPSRNFQADDVLFSFNRQKSPQHPFHNVNGGGYRFFQSLGLHKKIKSIDKIDDLTVRFVLNEASFLFPRLMAMEFAVILSKEYGDFLLKKNQPEKIDFEPVGTGPFILTQYVRGSLIRYKRNEDYYRGPAPLKRIVFAITADPNVRFQKLKKQECHLSAKPRPSDIPLMKKHKNIRVAKGAGWNLAYLAMNTEKAPYNNPKVRQALAHALNRKLYIKAIYKGMAETLNGPVPPGLWASHPDLKFPEYNPQKARQLLKEAGYEKGWKTELWTLPVSRPYNPDGKKMGELQQADLKAIGVQARLVTYDWASYLSQSARGEHELLQMGWSADIDDPSNFLQILLSSDSVSAGSNLSRWKNKSFDLLIAKALLKPRGKPAEALYLKAQEIFAQELPFIPLARAYHYSAFSPRLKGYVVKPFGSKNFYPLSLLPP